MIFAQMSEVRWFPQTASTLATEVDGLFYGILAVTLFFTGAIAVTVVAFIIRYRRRSDADRPTRIEGSLLLESIWTGIPTVIALAIFVWGARVYMHWAEPPPNALEVYAVGQQWMWKIQHPEGQSEINQLHVPVDTPVKVTLTSQDVIHSFFIPDFRAHMDAIPGRYTTAWFQGTRPGTYHLFCSEYCGTNHSSMIGEIIVMEPEAYQTWLTRGADRSLATKGRQLFQKLQCVTCHSADAKARAPVLENIYLRKTPLNNGRFVIADEAYIRESIRNPSAKIVAGYQYPSIMPPFGPELVNEEEMIQLIAFLKSLGRGETPPRVEHAEPPEVRTKKK